MTRKTDEAGLYRSQQQILEESAEFVHHFHLETAISWSWFSFLTGLFEHL